MRDPARIDRVLKLLYRYWHLYPDLRLAQIIGNFAPHSDTYHYEDDALIVALEAALESNEIAP